MIEAFPTGSPHTNMIAITAEIEFGFVAKDDLVPFRCSPVSSFAAPLQMEASMGGRQGQQTTEKSNSNEGDQNGPCDVDNLGRIKQLMICGVWIYVVEFSQHRRTIQSVIRRKLNVRTVRTNIATSLAIRGDNYDLRGIGAGTAVHKPTVDVRSNPQMALIVTGRKVTARKVKDWGLDVTARKVKDWGLDVPRS
ncbi:hypothetical protein TNCV_223261 [Trichonephila clavipes]|nr:hypothetical protein TNCV_223261 [Trichonephila clavipes]